MIVKYRFLGNLISEKSLRITFWTPLPNMILTLSVLMQRQVLHDQVEAVIRCETLVR